MDTRAGAPLLITFNAGAAGNSGPLPPTPGSYMNSSASRNWRKSSWVPSLLALGSRKAVAMCVNTLSTCAVPVRVFRIHVLLRCHAIFSTWQSGAIWLDACVSIGIEVYHLSPADLESFLASVQLCFDTYGSVIGVRIVLPILSLWSLNHKTLPYFSSKLENSWFFARECVTSDFVSCSEASMVWLI